MANLETIMEMAIAVPLDTASREIADGFASRAGRFAERVRRNTLAVLAVNRYLSWQDIETNLTVGNSWHPALRVVGDVADLDVRGLGRLECRVVAAGETEIELPLEVSEDRVAYVLLELSERPLGGRLLGLFVPGKEPIRSIALTDLMDMDESIEYVEGQLRLNAVLPSIKPVPVVSTNQAAANPLAQIQERVIDVSQWFNGKLDRVSELLRAEILTSPLEASLARSDTRSFKEILDEIKESIEIPMSVPTVLYPIGDDLTLNILCWQLGDEQGKWSILSILMPDLGRELPLQLRLQVHHNNELFAEEVTTEEMTPYLYICATDYFSESLEISIVSKSIDKTIFSRIFTLGQDFVRS
jgi:Protein of unknown function (DUF1822)